MSPFARFLTPLTVAIVLTGCGGDSPTSSTPTPVASNGLTVVSPNGKETFQVGGKIRIQWTSTNTDFSSARLLVDCGTGEWFDLTTSSINKKSADTSLTLPDSVYSATARANIVFPASSNCKVKIVDYVVSSILDTSDAPFTILAK